MEHNETWNEIAALRAGLLAQAEVFTPEQWEAPTLCDEWRVRDVVGHLVHPTGLRVLGTLPLLVRARFDPNRFIRDLGIRDGSVPIPDLLEVLRRSVTQRRSAVPGLGPGHVLQDLFVHLQDIRRPLGLPADYRSGLLTEVAALSHRNLRSTGLTRWEGLALHATDGPWRAGGGKEVRGTTEALIMALNARPVALAELSGSGAAVLASRMAE
jgi:uncharacterized protein (TIGR03083 family)